MGETSTTASSHVQSFPLALQPGMALHLSLHEDLTREVGGKLYSDFLETDDMALMDAERVVSVSQLVAAANIAVLRLKQKKNFTRLAFDVAHCAAGTTNFAKTSAEYCLESQDVSRRHETVSIFVFQVSTSSVDIYQRKLEDFELPPPQPIDSFLTKQLTSPLQVARVCQWYKLTEEEVAMSSLERAVLTRIGTKFQL